MFIILTGVRSKLMASADHVCPMDGCGETGISPDSLIPNKFLRTAVRNFLNESGYTKVTMQQAAPLPAKVDSPLHVPTAPPSPGAPVNRGFYRPPRDDSPHQASVSLYFFLICYRLVLKHTLET